MGEPLFVRRVHGTLGGGPRALFIHGLAGSTRYWTPMLNALDIDAELVDLAGFGRSLHAPSPYDIQAQAQRVAAATERPDVIVGHSMGALVARHMAKALPNARLVLFNPPLYPTRADAERSLREAGWMERAIVEERPIAERMCAVMCRFRKSARFVAPLLAPRLPTEVARDGALHTWRSFKDAFTSILDDAGAPLDDADTTAVLGKADPVAPPALVTPMLGSARVVLLDGDHHLPLRSTERCAALVDDVVNSTGATSRRPRDL